MTLYRGDDTSERLDASNWSFDWDAFRMYGGNDVVITQEQIEYYFNGYAGNDYFLGNSASDFVVGGDGDDRLIGQGGNDKLYGGLNDDALTGGQGDDYIVGGGGRDTLSGSEGSDVFSFGRYDTGLKKLVADVIRDWDVRADFIETIKGKGTAQNYGELATSATTIEAAASQAEATAATTNKTFTFLYNASKDAGFLVMDLNSDGKFESGVVIVGAGSAADMSYLDLI